jgi:predicted PurR-regulated permease PerM
VFRLDDRTGNVLTTIASFAAVIAVAYTARETIVAGVLALLLAYILEPIVSWVERRLSNRSHPRGLAIAAVYGVGAMVAIATADGLLPLVIDQFRALRASIPALAARADAMRGTGFGRTVSTATAGATRVAVSVAREAAWFLLVPVLAVFFLDDRAALLEAAVNLGARRGDPGRAQRTIQKVDHTLAEYTRAQLALAGLSAAFYLIMMLVLRVPCALALALIGGALELVPIVGWIIAAMGILLSAWLAGSHWILLGVLIVVWRLVQNFVNSPRIMGGHLQMSPLSVLVGLMLGGQIGGFAGAILSVPVIAVCRVLWLGRESADAAPAALIRR